MSKIKNWFVARNKFISKLYNHKNKNQYNENNWDFDYSNWSLDVGK